MFPDSDPERLRGAFFDSPEKDLLESGRISPRRFLDGAGRRLGLHIDPVLFADFWTDIFSENRDISALIPALRQRYRLALLSNTNKPHMDYIGTAFPVVHLFHHRFLSYEMQLLKPDTAIFREALRALGSTPAQTLFIDDSEANTAAAASLGMPVIHFRNNADFLETAHTMGIL
ncbi:HAD-IA family hydrolase [bacterium]|nr:HAD-IA family hydrolase [bacterium]